MNKLIINLIILLIFILEKKNKILKNQIVFLMETKIFTIELNNKNKTHTFSKLWIISEFFVNQFLKIILYRKVKCNYFKF